MVKVVDSIAGEMGELSDEVYYRVAFSADADSDDPDAGDMLTYEVSGDDHSKPEYYAAASRRGSGD